MPFFRKDRSKKDPERHAGIQDKLALKLAGLISKLQTMFAGEMNRLFDGVSPSRMKKVLLLFCAVTCLLSSYCIIKALKTDSDHNSLKVDHSKTPGYFDKTGEAPTHNGVLIDEESFSKVQVFRRYMDSLKVSDSSKFDSIQRQRPGLMDSITTLESLYYTQKIK